MSQRCSAKNRNGKPCGAWSAAGEDKCALHLILDWQRRWARNMDAEPDICPTQTRRRVNEWREGSKSPGVLPPYR